MNNNIFLVAKREYIRTVRKRSFWIATLMFPLFIIGVGFVSGTSSQSLEDQATKIDPTSVLIIDDSGILNKEILGQTYRFLTDKEDAINKVRTKEESALIYYPENLVDSKEIETYVSFEGINIFDGFSEVGKSLIRQSILSQIEDPLLIELYHSEFDVKTTTYEDGAPEETSFEQFIAPLASLVIYFILVMISANFLLQSVSEEKENRMIEIVLSIMKPRNLIIGKIIGQTSIVLTQFAVLVTFGLLGLHFLLQSSSLPFDLSLIVVTPGQILVSLFYLICGFLFMAAIMVGVGAAMPTYREASSFSSIFIIMAVAPLWVLPTIFVEPSGTLAMIGSYFPFTAPMILLFRNVLGELSLIEILLSSLLLILYVAGGFFLAFRLFEIGSLEYNNRIDFKEFGKSLLKTLKFKFPR